MPRKATTKSAGPKRLTDPKGPLRWCGRGHRLYGDTKRENCHSCHVDALRQRDAELRAARAEAERAEWREKMGPVPDVLRTIVVSTGKVHVHAIPPHLIRRRPVNRPKRRRAV